MNFLASGRNNWGQLGLGDYINRNIFTKLNTNHIMELQYNFPGFEIDTEIIISI
jgi:hypothetical protein